MRLKEYREKVELSYGQVAKQTGIPKTIIFRACTEEGYCLKLRHAQTIVKWSQGQVSYEDLMAGDC